MRYRPFVNLGLDIDGTITSAPRFFSQLSRAWRGAGRRVHVISSRSDTPEVRRESSKELLALGIAYDSLNLLPSIEACQQDCPHKGLDWYAKYLWQKVAIAQALDVSVFVDDDVKVLRLFREFAPGIQAHSVPPGVDRDSGSALDLTGLALLSPR